MPDTVERDTIAARRAQLDDMPFDTIEAWLLERGFVVVDREWHRSAVNTLLYDAQANGWTGPLGKRWPPLADDDLPFDGDDRGD